MNIYDVYSLQDVVIEGVDMSDYPDFVDAYISSATDSTGNPLTESQLEHISENESAFVQEMAHDQITGGA
jgi:hypothetical protein|tara:strand:+ start:2371 stop:2580 length:210 start_codon:yes stop_codon:yes gene_type:complete